MHSSFIAASPPDDPVVLSSADLALAAGGAVLEPMDAVGAGARLLDEGASTVLVHLGCTSAVLVDDGGAYHAESIPAPGAQAGLDTTGALLAGFRAAGGHGPEALSEGIAWAAAALRGAGETVAPSEADRASVLITWIDAVELIRDR
jgi:1-phosphofructokinase